MALKILTEWVPMYPDSNDPDQAENGLHLRGLSFQDITQIMQTHADDLDQLFDLIQQQVAGKDAMAIAAGVDVSGLGMKLLAHFPDLVALVMSIAADGEESPQALMRTPGGFQLACLEAIVKLTVEPAGGAKKFVARLLGMAQGLRMMAA